MTTTTAGGIRAVAFGIAVACLMLWSGYCAAEEGVRPDTLNMKIERPIMESPPPKPKMDISGDTITIHDGGTLRVFRGARLEERADGVLQIVAESLTEDPPGGTRTLRGPVSVWGPRVGCSGVWWDLLDDHAVPICYEWSAVDTDGGKVSEPTMPGFRAEAGETVETVVRALVARSDGALDLYVASGVPWLRPSSASYTTVSALDVPVSVNVSGVSAWEAVKAVVRAVNTASDLRLSLGFPLLLALNSPPAAFTEEKCVSLAVEGATAREALSAVISQSPVAVAFRYSNRHPARPATGDSGETQAIAGHLDLYAFEYGMRPTKGEEITPERYNWWIREIREASQPLTQKLD